MRNWSTLTTLRALTWSGQIERFQTYFKTLEGLSTEQLDRSAEKLVRAEKKNVALVIAHIAEISRRKGERERGYKNILDYCVRRLHLSEGTEMKLIAVITEPRVIDRILSHPAGKRQPASASTASCEHSTARPGSLILQTSGSYTSAFRPAPKP